ncbi:hypothetical protein BDR26DRAFT_902363 [Obelidium mucronatum]|nr:hypothetical protein BDR26DRAFT_902363 [Obelidium mucronatum]
MSTLMECAMVDAQVSTDGASEMRGGVGFGNISDPKKPETKDPTFIFLPKIISLSAMENFTAQTVFLLMRKPLASARRVTEAEKRAFANMSKTGSSSQALQASGSSKRLHEEIDDDDNDGDEDQDQNQENQTSVTQSLLATSPAPAASTPTPLVAQLSSILNTQLSAQSAQSATSSRTVRPTSWVWNYFDKSKTVQKSNLGEGRFAYLCQVKMSEGRLCEKAITAETKSSTGALSKHLKESHGLKPPQPAAESNTPKRCKTVADFMQKRLQLPTDINLETVRYIAKIYPPA